jgi:glycosyltransferase involved in cell wall biosynthesis
MVPSLAEMFGLVYCEANSFGMPAIATKTGGIPSVIKHNKNGLIYNLEESSINIANDIKQIFTNKDLYMQLAKSSFNEFETRLNWDVACKKAIAEISKII